MNTIESPTQRLEYQPFAAVPELKELEKTLYVNVSDTERLLSLAGGTALLVAGMQGGKTAGLLLSMAGGSLLWRALSGHCALYERLGKDTRHY